MKVLGKEGGSPRAKGGGQGAEENDQISAALVSNVFIQLNESLMDKTSNSSILDEL